MIVERFKTGQQLAVEQRYQLKGRMLPDDVVYHASWMKTDGSVCFQIMEAPNRDALEPWIGLWSDLVDFEVTAVQTSQQYWQGVKLETI